MRQQLRVAIVLLGVVGAALPVVLGGGGGAKHEVAAAAPASGPLVRRCDAGSSVPVPAARDAGRDFRAGRLVIGAFRGNFEHARASQVYSPRPGVKVLKAPVVFRGRGDLTLSVPAPERGRLTLDYGPKGSSIRFQACPRGRRASGFPGAFEYTGPWPRCVPLRVDGARVLLPLGRSCR